MPVSKVCLASLGLVLVSAGTAAEDNSEGTAKPWWQSVFGASVSSKNTGKDASTEGVVVENSELKSPLLNRELVASVKAHSWPTLPSNALCEAMAFFQQEDHVMQTANTDSNEASSNGGALVMKFLDLLSNEVLEASTSSSDKDMSLPLSDWENAMNLVIKVTSASEKDSLKPLVDLLQWSLQLRANTPLCEVHRGLARQTLQQTNRLATFGNENEGVLGVLLSRNRPASLLTSMDQFARVDWKSLAPANASETAGQDGLEEELSMESHLLPQELPLPGTGSPATCASLLILYANMDSPEFAQTYRYLRTTVTDINIPIIVRSLGAIHFEENPLSAEPTTLAGYGVRLDIRNVEYKVFDERKTTTTKEEQDEVMVNLTESKNLMSSSYLAGVNLTMIVGDEPSEETLKLRDELWNKHEAQQVRAQKIPPLWQRRQLPLQAATVLVQQQVQSSGDGDILSTLTHLAQDLPSVASTLVQVKIPPHVHEWASAIWDQQQGDGYQLTPGQFYVNGRPSSVNRPSFNIFEVLNVVRMEDRRVRNLETTLSSFVACMTSPVEALLRIQEAWMAGSNFGNLESNEDETTQRNEIADSSKSSKVYRVDVARGWQKSVMYVNDVEKDPQYRQWTRSFQQMIMSLQFGMPPSIRRNLYTMMVVMNPTTQGQSGVDNAGFDFALKLVQNQYPVRLGLILVDEDDLEKCQTWLLDNSGEENKDEPCPVENKIISDGDDWDKTPGTARAVHRLVAWTLKEYGSLGASLGFVEYYFNYIGEKIRDEGPVSMQDLVTIYGTLVEMMGVGIAAAIEKDAKTVLRDNESNESENVYGKALRFAAERGLAPGMSFLNGRPLSQTQDGVHSIFSDEQSHLMNMIMTGQITDSSPRSIYGKLMSGPSLFKRMHPLLLSDQSTSDSYQAIQHPFDEMSLLLTGQESSNPVAYFVVDVVLDYDTQEGLAQLSNLLESIEQFPTSSQSSDEEDGASQSFIVGYRVLPSSVTSATSALCPVLGNAGLFGLSNLKSIVRAMMGSVEGEKTLEELLVNVESKNAKVVMDTRDICQSGFPFQPTESLTPRAICNGRLYKMGNSLITSDDIDLFVSLEINTATAVYYALKEYIPEGVAHRKIAASISSVAQFLSVEQTKSTTREDVMLPVRKLEKQLNLEQDTLMRFHWNQPSADDSRLKPRVTAVIDPVHISTQRMAPLLMIFRDHLKIPVSIVLAPATSIGGDSDVPITSYYRFVTAADADLNAFAHFSSLPSNHVLTVRIDVPEPWDVQQTKSIQDSDNLRCDLQTGCGDDAHIRETSWTPASIKSSRQLTEIEYGLNHLLAFGQCYEASGPPNGLQLVLSKHSHSGLGSNRVSEAEVSMDGLTTTEDLVSNDKMSRYSDTLVMKNIGYWQLRANPGVWSVEIDQDSKGAEMFDFSDATMSRGRLIETGKSLSQKRKVVLKDFVSKGEILFVKRRPGYEKSSLFFGESSATSAVTKGDSDDEVIHVFSLATGHLYERFLKIMMLSVTRRTSAKVKFWLFENFLSPTFKETSRAMADRIGCEVEFVTYKWPEWLRGQIEKQRIIWGYKILFLDVLFPLSVKKIIYVDADQVVRADLKELWDMDLQGTSY